jgi:hypothetical protein
MREVNYKDMKFNPFNLLGKEWMLVSAGNEQDGCNTMTISWGHLGCLWGNNDPTSRYLFASFALYQDFCR